MIASATRGIGGLGATATDFADSKTENHPQAQAAALMVDVWPVTTVAQWMLELG